MLTSDLPIGILKFKGGDPMIRFKTFSYGPGLFGAKNTHEEIEIFLNEIGQENIIFFTCKKWFVLC